MSLTTHIRRIACLWFPDWPLQRLLVVHPEYRHLVLLIVEQTRRGEFVRHVNWTAFRRGVRIGMPLSEAQSCVRPHDQLVVEPIQPVEDRQALGKLAIQCEPFSPYVGLEEAEASECLLLDVTGIGSFFSGEAGLAEQIRQRFQQHVDDVRIAIADTVGAAWAAVHCLAQSQQPAIMPSGEVSPFLPLPLAALRLLDADLVKLHRLGIKTAQQLLDLDRLSIRTRFGADLLLRIDQLTGKRDESITPYHPPPRYHIERTLEEGITHPDVIEQFWMTLLQQLLTRLRTNGLGTRRVDVEFLQEGRPPRRVELRLCEFTADVKHLSDLLRLKLEQHPWESPLVGIDMEAKDIAPPAPSQSQLFSGGSQNHARQFSMLLNRMSSRLGREAVVHPHLLPDPIPERAVHYTSVTDQLESTPCEIRHLYFPLDRPTGTFPEPRTIEVITTFPEGPPRVVFRGKTRLDIASHWGPERIESGWWGKASIKRDYYWVETTEGHWLWLFKQLSDRCWFWHGEV